MTTILKAYYDGKVFIPMKPVDIQKGKVLLMSILKEDTTDLVIAKKLTAFKQITENLRKINDVEPLPAEFDEILSQRIHFKNVYE
jgi:predicted DNA-binding antitoxin AbrB/MazE fold protein